MEYASYEFYTEEYLGSMTEADFTKWVKRASRQLDVITSRRLLSSYPEDDEYSDQQIKMCVCEMAEKMADVDAFIKAQSVKEDGTAGVIQSKSAGNESMTYAIGESTYSSIAKDPQGLDKQLWAIVVRYLAFAEDSTGVCLLYRGL